MQPVLDKRTGVGCFAGFLPQAIFPDRQRADYIQPGLYDNNTYCAQMNETEPGIPDPAPPPDNAGDNEYQPENHKGDKQGVNDQQPVGGKQ